MIDSWDSATKLLASAFSDIDVHRGDGESEIKNDSDVSFSHQNHLQVREESWLMRWKERNKSSVKNRIANRKDTKSRDGRSTRKVFTDISLESYVTEERVPKDVYFVTLNAPNGVGMNLFVSYGGLVLVQGLYKLRNGSSSPAQNCGVIAVGDQLVQLNDINIEALSFYETTDLLKDLDLLAKDKIITLGFRYMDAPVFLPAEPEDPQRKVNHENVPISQSEHSQSQSVPVETTNLQNIQNVMSLRQSPMVEDAFLALFALDEAEGFGVLPSTRSNARARPDPTPFTSELDTLQQQMRQRHMYPTAARVSALSGTTHPAALLHEVAEEVYEWRPVQLCRQYAGYYTPRAVSDISTAHGAVLSGLIVSPQDTAVYQNTQQLVWCDENQCYVEPPSRLATVPDTFVDNANSMKEVLQTIESEYLQILTDSVLNPALKEDVINGTPGSTKTIAYAMKQTIGATPTVIAGSKGQSTLIMHGTSITSGGTSNKCVVKPTVYNMSSMVPTKKQPYYYLKQSDFISKEHSSVQQLLSLPSTVLLTQLSTIVDSAIENIASMNTTQTTTNTDNPFHNAKYYETHTEISIPPMLLTYQLLYSAQHLKPILLQSESFLSILERWATTFDPKGILHALQAQSKLKSSSTEQVNRRSLSPAGSSASRAPHEILKKKEFLVYFNNDSHTVRNLQPFVDVMKELLTFLLVCRVSPSIVRIMKSIGGSGGLMEYASSTSGNTNSTLTSLGKSFRLLPVTLDLLSTTANSVPVLDTSDCTYPDTVAASCIRKFGLLLFLETVAVSASAAQYTRTLQAAIDTAGLDNTYHDCTQIMQQLLAKSVGTMLSAQQLIDQLSVSTNKNLESTKATTSDRSNASCPYLLCLVLQHLETIFAQNTQLALDLSTLLYPLISPWNVQHTLFPPEERGNTDSNEESTERGAQSTINALNDTVIRQFQGIGVSSSVNTSTATSLSSSTVPSPAASPRTTNTGKIDASMLSPLLPPMPPLQSPPLLSAVHTSPQSVLPMPVTLTPQKAGNKVQLSSQTERELDRLLSRTSSNQSMLSMATVPVGTFGLRIDTSTVPSKSLNQASQVPQHSLQGGLCAQNAYYGYLTRLFRMHTSLGQNAPVLVLSWLETALSLAHQDTFHAGNDAFSVHASVYATPKGKKKNPFAITVRNLLHSQEQYCMDTVAAMELCAKYSHFEGVATVCERLIQCDATSTAFSTSSQTLQLHPTDLSNVLNVLTQASGKQVSTMLTLVNQIHESEIKSKQASIVASSSRSEAYQSVSASTSESPELESLNSMCTTCTSLLRQLLRTARALCQHQRVYLREDLTSSHSLSFLAGRFESPEWSIFGDILNTIALEQFYELPAQTGVVYDRMVLSCASNMLGECVRFAVGTEGALLTLQHAPVLVDLIPC